MPALQIRCDVSELHLSEVDCVMYLNCIPIAGGHSKTDHPECHPSLYSYVASLLRSVGPRMSFMRSKTGKKYKPPDHIRTRCALSPSFSEPLVIQKLSNGQDSSTN